MTAPCRDDCLVCGKDLVPPQRLYCSKKCRSKGWSQANQDVMQKSREDWQERNRELIRERDKGRKK